MTTGAVLDPVAELEQMLERHDSVEPVISIAEDMALVSFRRGDRGWQMRGTYAVAG
jgi:hypothetical protein